MKLQKLFTNEKLLKAMEVGDVGAQDEAGSEKKM